MFRSLVALLPLVAAVLAGCVSETTESPGVRPQPFVWVDPITTASDHDHTDPAQHRLGLNVTKLSHEPLIDQEGESAHSHSIDLCDRWLVLGRSQVGQYGVDIVDVEDAGNPVWVGRYRDAEAVPGDRDVAWSADCNYVFMANQGSTPESSGVLVINAHDKAKPVKESRYMLPNIGVPGVASVLGSGVHTVYAHKAGTEQFVYALNYGVHILKMVPGSNGKQTLQFVGRYVTADAERLAAANQGGPDATATRRTIYGHDMTVYTEANRVVMYVANAYDGLRIVDITNPATPRDLAHWVPDTPGAPHYVHGVKSFLREDGRRITVVESETFEDRNTDTPSPLWVLDTTSPANVRLLATWSNPGGHGSDHLLFSQHFFEVEDSRVWLTHYHGGVWVINIEEPSQPWVEGYYLPSEDTVFRPDPKCCAPFKLAGVPMSYDLKLRDGVAYVADASTGLYVLSLA